MTEYDPFAPETLESPYPFYTALHAEAPVYMVPGRDLAIVSTFDLIHEVVRDMATCSSAMPTGPVNLVRTETDDPELKALRAEQLRQVPTLLSADPPRHGRYRALVNKAFAARRVAGMEDYIRCASTPPADGRLCYYSFAV